MESIQYKPLGAVSEALYVLETEHCPRSGYTAVIFRGRPDPEAFKKAVDRVISDMPSLACKLEERKVGLQYRLFRVPVENPGLEFRDDFAHGLKGRTISQAMNEYFEPTYLRGLDIFCEAAGRFHLFRFPDDVGALALFNHHIAADGSTLISIFRNVFAAYHEVVTGLAPEWAKAEALPSSIAREVPSASAGPVLSDMFSEGRARAKNPVLRFGRDVQITSAKRNIVSFRLTEDETRQAAKKAKAKGLTVNDLLSVAIVRGVDDIMGSPEGTLSLWIPVNARAISAGQEDRSNLSTSISIDLIRLDRVNEDRLAEKIVSRRKYLLSRGHDVVSIRLLEKLLGIAYYFPVRMRTPRLRKLMTRPTTIMSSNFGILWPRMENGRPTIDSFMTHAGGLEILDYEVNFSTVDSVGHGIVAYTFRGRLKANFSAYEQTMDRRDAERFMERVRLHMLD